ncbi:carboxymuconolactone decarboxylase family protein [Saliphagus sp. GCM10025308]
MATETHAHDDTRSDIEETLGIVPGFLDTLPEEALDNEWPTMKRFLFGETALDPKTRELVGLAVAAAIGCEYCRHFHRGWHSSTARPRQNSRNCRSSRVTRRDTAR